MKPTTLELDGVTSFRSHPRSSFRFILTLKDNKLNVWLENRKSKKQWQSGYLGLDEFVSSENAVPGAKLDEYAECFKAALEDADDKSAAPVELDADNGLKPVAIERIDIAESRLFDVEQEVERIVSGRLSSPTVAHLDVAAASTASQQVSWKPVSSDLIAVDNGIKVLVMSDGVFLVAMHISHTVQDRYGIYYFQLLKGDQAGFCCSVPYCQGHPGYVSASWIVQMKAGNKLSLVGQSFSIQVGSKMAITKLSG